MTPFEKAIGYRPIGEGKTKKLYRAFGEEGRELAEVYIVSKDDMTAGNGAKHDLLKGKATYANRITCNVFQLLRPYKVPLAFIEKVDSSIPAFLAMDCTMLPLEVVIRRAAYGSYLKRHPETQKGAEFPGLLVEFFLKTTGQKWQGFELPCDDPLMEFLTNGIQLHIPNKPFESGSGFGEVSTELTFPKGIREKAEIEQHARLIFLVLERAWANQKQKLVDMKIEFGYNAENMLVLADVIDNDSWRVLDDSGQHMDKQLYRDGDTELAQILDKYRQVAELTSRWLQ